MITYRVETVQSTQILLLLLGFLSPCKRAGANAPALLLVDVKKVEVAYGTGANIRLSPPIEICGRLAVPSNNNENSPRTNSLLCQRAVA